MKKLLFIIVLACVLFSDITPAGVTISNQAKVYVNNHQYVKSSNTVHTIIATIHGLDLSDSLPQTILTGQTAYFPKQLYNIGNVSESV
jgi:hypothetical protein